MTPSLFPLHFPLNRLRFSYKKQWVFYFLVIIGCLSWQQNGFSQTINNPILFCTQVPNARDFTTMMSTFGNHTNRMSQAPRGGDLYILFPNGTLKNLTQLAGYGETGMQGANAIAIRDPHVHWSGTKAIFSMVIGAPIERYQYNDYYWQLYEVSGLGINDTPVISKVPNQPADYNNIAPIYGTDDRIIFETDRPRNGQRHLYPQHDEYESSPTTTGLWKIDPKACPGVNSLEMLTTAPSGDFTPIIDSYGRIVFTRWDHLKRDQQFDADFLGDGTAYGTLNFSDETENATKYIEDIEVFPEPLNNRTDLFALPEWQNTNPININIFTPWMVNEDGKEIETLNHIGRHEMGIYFARNFTNDPNLSDFVPIAKPVRNFFHIKESPVTSGLYIGTDAPEFSTHAAGQILSMYLPAHQSAANPMISYMTHPDTRNFTASPSGNHSGLYRNPVPLANGAIIVSHTTETNQDSNDGTIENPTSRYAFRLKYLVQNGTYYEAGSALTNGISKNVSWYTPDNMATYNGELWETFPVEVRARPKPSTSTLNTVEVPATEQTIFDAVGIAVKDMKRFLTRNKLALSVTRDVTSRDDLDQQQPYNLKVVNSNTQTVDPNNSDNVYEVEYLQYLQGDQIRGIGAREGLNDPDINPGRRTLAQYMHDTSALRYNLPTTGDEGSINLASDGSVAAFVPGNRAMTWQLTDANDKPIVRERVWLSFQEGEIRVCTSCHGENDLNQAGTIAPINAPLALTQLLNHVKTIDTDNDNTVDLYDAYPLDNSRHIGEVVNDDFKDALSNWINNNPDMDGTTWETANVPCKDEVVVINNQAGNSGGTMDQLSRYIDLTEIYEASLSFDVAYASLDATTFDGLSVKVQSCDNTNPTTVYEKSGSELATVPNQQTLFSPSNCDQWRTEIIDLSAFVGQAFELVFENIGGGGNQLFLDNIKILESNNLSADCTMDKVTLTDDIASNSTIAVQDTLTASNVILATATVTYKAGKAINLLPGFQVTSGSNFSAIIEDCSMPSLQEESTTYSQLNKPVISIPTTENLDLQLKVYPNPFNYQANIAYFLPQKAVVNIKILDIIGQEVQVIKQKTVQAAGNYQVNFQSQNLENGTYFIMLQSGKSINTECLILIK